MMTDCLLIGMNSQRFGDYVGMVKALGADGGAYRDLNLSFIEVEGKPVQALDLLTEYYRQQGGERRHPFHNADFLWPSITYLGTYLHRHGLSFDFVNTFQLEREALRQKLQDTDVLTVAITTTLYVVPWPIQEIVNFVRECNERVRIIVGGPYIANTAKSPDRAGVAAQLHAIGADYYVVSSEGEQTLVSLIEALKAGGDLGSVNNLIYRDRGEWVFTPTRVERSDISQNMVDYSLFSREAIGQFVSTRTAKSCPFACAYCNFPQQSGKYTYTTVETVEAELDAIRDIGSVTTVTFIDDTFNVPKKRFKAVLEMMIRNAYPFKWNCNYRCDHGDDEIIALMARAGCEGVFLGVESGSNQMLQNMNKTARREDYLRAIPRLKEEGILAHANLFVGYPGETMDTIAETLDLVSRTKPDTFSAQIWYANPLTSVFKKKSTFEIVGSSFRWAHKTMDAATACDLVDRIFLGVDDSTFLPQYGFFQWSMFYLQRFGMGVDQIKRYLSCFNALVREKLIGSGDEQVRARLMANLARAARFDHAVDELEPSAMTLFSGDARQQAEEFCARYFSGMSDDVGSLDESLGSDVARPWTTTSFSLDEETTARLLQASDGAPHEAPLGALEVLLWLLNELEPVAVIAGLPDSGGTLRPVPVIGSLSPEMSFRELLDDLGHTIESAWRWRLHAFDILSGSSRVGSFHARRPIFAAAYTHGDDDPADLVERIPQHEDVRLRVHTKLDTSRLMVTLSARCERAPLDTVATHFRRVMTDLAHPGSGLQDLRILASFAAPAREGASALATEEFAF
ncbi:MAG: PhpK family radical SAM P-methyltransferase [Myxococcales bacterium]|nr:PhpK family radical SAM P-methyltransferase [Myxococcales bacterium]